MVVESRLGAHVSSERRRLEVGAHVGLREQAFDLLEPSRRQVLDELYRRNGSDDVQANQGESGGQRDETWISGFALDIIRK